MRGAPAYSSRIAMIIACGAVLAALACRAETVWAAEQVAPLQAAQWASSCVTCHGAASAVSGSAIPMLAGRPVVQIEEQMKAFASGSKAGVLMQQIAKGYRPDEIHAIALWYAQLVPEEP